VLAVDEPRTHEITGAPHEVAMVLRVARLNDRLRSSEVELRRSLVEWPDGRVSVRAVLQTPVPPERRSHPVAREVGRALARASLFVAVLGGLAAVAVYAVAALLSRAADAVDGGRVAGVALGALILWLLFSVRRGHACRGIHCDGCSRG